MSSTLVSGFAPSPHRSPRLRRGRSKARAPVARKLCLFAPMGEGLSSAGLMDQGHPTDQEHVLVSALLQAWRRRRSATHPLACPSPAWGPAW
ncbi:hypothetical protein XavaCFBP5823_09585 [Xanthomonas axonopodis pv. vasculorum]|nr:hypothetical protein XavaCFBP5823_09585 [Xanthomonas axonopodis pv. vasculorum]